MPSIEIISETPITMSEFKQELEKVKARDSELSFRGTKTEEYLNTYVKLDSSQQESLKKKITELNIPRLRDEHIVKIIDLMPSAAEEVKLILQGYALTISKENLNKIVAVLGEFAPEKK